MLIGSTFVTSFIKLCIWELAAEGMQGQALADMWMYKDMVGGNYLSIGVGDNGETMLL